MKAVSVILNVVKNLWLNTCKILPYTQDDTNFGSDFHSNDLNVKSMIN